MATLFYLNEKRPQRVYMWEGGDYLTEYQILDGEIQKDNCLRENFTENGTFPAPYLQEVTLENLEPEIQDQIEYDLEDQGPNSWGGTRPGAGRKPINTDDLRINISVSLPQSLVEKLDAQSELENAPRSQVLNEILNDWSERIFDH